MKTRLQNELNAVLLPYSISGFRIFRDWLIKKAGLEEDCHKYCYFESYSKKEELWINIRRLHNEHTVKLLAFLGKDEIKNNLIQLDETLLFDQLLPEFISEIKTDSFFSAENLIKYQLLSKDAIEDNLVKNMVNQATNLLEHYKIIAPGQEGKQDPFITQVTTFIHHCRQYQDYGEINYQWHVSNLIANFTSIKGFVNQNPSLIKCSSFLSSLKSLVDMISLFERNNHAQERRLNKQFIQEIDGFLLPWRITTTKCDIFEHMLFQFAGLAYRPKYIQFNAHFNKLRVSFWFSHPQDMGEDAKKLLQFFHEQGDVSALFTRKKRSKDRQEETEQFIELMNSDPCLSHEEVQMKIKAQRELFGYTNPYNGINIRSNTDKPFSLILGKPPVEYSFTCDARILREIIWPKLKIYIEQLAKNDIKQLLPYQQKCETYFEERTKEKTSTTKQNPANFFNKTGNSKRINLSPIQETESRGQTTALGFQG